MSDENLHFEDDSEIKNAASADEAEKESGEAVAAAPVTEPEETTAFEAVTESETVRKPENAREETPRRASLEGASPRPSEAFPHAAPRRRGGVPAWALIVALVLCVALSFGGAFVGFVAARMIPDAPGIGGTETPTPNGDGTDAESGPSHLLENPEDILDKSEPNDSIYGSAGEEVFAVSGVVRKVQDAVVVIRAKVVSTIFGQSSVQTSAGSGVVLSADGYVLTCNHVVDGASEVEVILNSGKSYLAVLVGSDAASDLAVLKIDPAGESLVFVEQGCSEDLVLGEQVVAIGNPLGTLDGTVTTGIVSATEREIQMSDGSSMTLIQTDAAINSGNSGGGLFNLAGQLIGIVNAKYSASGVEGLAFAIPIDSAYTVQLDLIEFGYVRGVVDHGLKFLEITEGMLRDFYYGNYYASRGITEAGLYVIASEYEESLENADLIRSVNGTEVKTQADFDAIVEDCKVGDVLTLVVAKRQEKWAETTVELELREFVPERLKGTLN